jgi:hypothetical protein
MTQTRVEYYQQRVLFQALALVWFKNLPQQERSARAVDAVLNAVTESIAAGRLPGCADLARNSGVAEGSLYRYFDGMREVYGAWLALHGQTLRARLAVRSGMNAANLGDLAIKDPEALIRVAIALGVKP